MSNSYINTETKYQIIPRNRNPYLPPLPFKKQNYHYQTLNINSYNNNNNYFIRTRQGLSKSFSASNFGYKDNLYNTKIQQNYINNILIPHLDNLHNEKMKYQLNYQNKLNLYDENVMYEIRKNQELNDINNKILKMQVSQKKIYSAEKQRNKIRALFEINRNIEEYNNNIINEKINIKRMKQIYSLQLEHQIISVLQNKLDRYDEMSNRSRIKNKLLLDSYINSFNNTVNNV